MTQFKGDTGKFRKALAAAGFAADDCIFNDKNKGSRRLKLWFATEVFNSPQKQQLKLERELKAAFGGRIETMYFSANTTPWGWASNVKSMCIKLKN